MSNISDLDAWWEGEDSETPFDPVELFVEESPDNSGTWGDIGSLGTSYSVNVKRIPETIQTVFSSLTKIKNADEWMRLLRHINTTIEIRPFMQKSEGFLYQSKTSINLSKDYIANPLNQLYFHMLRAYDRAKENDFDAATIIWNNIADECLDCANEYTQPYILSHLYMTSLCIAQWEQAVKYLQQLWSIIKFMNANKRHAFGAWDEWTMCLIVTWTFLKCSTEFYKVFCKDFMGQANIFRFQRKITILEHVNNTFFGSIIEEAYYKKAQELTPKLPETFYKEKISYASLRLSMPDM